MESKKMKTGAIVNIGKEKKKFTEIFQACVIAFNKEQSN